MPSHISVVIRPFVTMAPVMARDPASLQHPRSVRAERNTHNKIDYS